MSADIIEYVNTEMDWGPLYEYVRTLPKKKPREPYRVGRRENHKAPCSRTWTETWAHEDDEGFTHYHFHQGVDFLGHPEFWQEVEFCSGKNTTVPELQDLMKWIPRPQIEEGYRHYYDKWNWENSSERNYRLMKAFENELAVPNRMADKECEYTAMGEYMKKFGGKTITFIDDGFDFSKLTFLAPGIPNPA